MQLDEFFSYKNRLMETLCSNAEIAQLVTDNSAIELPAHSLRYTQIFPFEFVPETVDSGKTFICYDVDIVNVVSKTFYVPVLYVWIFTHKSKMRLSQGGIRIDCLAAAIDKELNGNRNFGLGTLELSSVTRFVPISDFQGRVLTYTAKDFNRVGISKPTPAYRRRYE